MKKYRGWDIENNTMYFSDKKEENEYGQILWEFLNGEIVFSVPKLIDRYCPSRGHIQEIDYDQPEQKIMSFTGLTDVNGKDIFEGDVLKCHQFLFDGNEIEKEWIVSIFYSIDHSFTRGGIAGFCLKIISGDFYFDYTDENKGDEDTWLPMSHVYGLHKDSFEIIGNIYENPDLLT